ncbi:YitT family protein [Anaerotruncus sp. AF02-27]|nr:YitT family protein [Anaerotruncus sp. AF02-27]
MKEGVWMAAKMPDQFFDTLLDLLFVTLGCASVASGIQAFIAPNHIALGGVSGLSILFNYLSGAPIGALSLLMNIPLLLLGWKFLGRAFTAKTLAAVLISSFLLDYVAVLVPKYEGDALLAALFGGALVGFGLALVFMRGATTGGSDIVSRLLQLKMPHIQLGRLLLGLDVVVILISAAVFGRIETALYGMVAVFTSSRVIDGVLYGRDTGKLVYIMSKKAGEISGRVMLDLQRGCTLLKSTGAFTQSDSQVILVAVRRQQYFQLKKIVQRIDPAAFIIVTDSTEVIGHGFKQLNEK